MAINNRNDELENALNSLGSLNAQELDILQKTIIQLKEIKQTRQEQIPCSIFSKKLSSFESIVKYLKEEEHLTYRKIAEILKRTPSTIGVTYKHAREKQRSRFSSMHAPYISQDIFSKKMTVFESIIEALNREYPLKKVAEITKRDYRTIWTVKNRKKYKRAT